MFINSSKGQKRIKCHMDKRGGPKYYDTASGTEGVGVEALKASCRWLLLLFFLSLLEFDF